MKAVFLIHRTSVYRYLTPVIRESLKRGHTVECWHDYSQPKYGVKAYAFAHLEHAPDFGDLGNPSKKTFCGKIDMIEKLASDPEIDVVFAPSSFHHFLPGVRLDRFSFEWATVMAGFDNFHEFREAHPPLEGDRRQLFFAHSETMLEKGRAFLNKFSPDRASNLDDRFIDIRVVGMAECDTFRDVESDLEIRAKYKIPNDKPVLLYLPFPYFNLNKNSAWERAFYGYFTNTKKTNDHAYIHDRKKNVLSNVLFKTWCLYNILKDPVGRDCFFRGITIEKIFQAVRDFCDKNGLYLVIKPRLKNPLSEIEKRKSDLIVWDDETQQDPPVLKELLAISRLSMSYSSTAIRESVFANVFHLNITLPEIFNPSEEINYWYSPEEGWMFNSPGIGISQTIEECIENLRDLSLEELKMDAAAKAQFIKKFSGFEDYSTSRRILDIVEEKVRSRQVSTEAGKVIL